LEIQQLLTDYSTVIDQRAYKGQSLTESIHSSSVQIRPVGIAGHDRHSV
jgi:hypothetical protein